MMVAQQLYEGIDLKKQGTIGLITYMRTDSTRISDTAKAEAKQYITINTVNLTLLNVKHQGNKVTKMQMRLLDLQVLCVRQMI